MKLYFITALAALALLSCKPKTTTEVSELVTNEQATGEASYGTLTATISFEIKLPKEEAARFGQPTMQYLSIAAYTDEIKDLIDPDQIVLKETSATLLIDYPLNNPARIELKSAKPEGFTRAEILRAICDNYKQIYIEEEASAKTKTVPMEERKGLSNRNTTDGKYGIWGHDIDDLVLSDIEVYEQDGGKMLIVPLVES